MIEIQDIRKEYGVEMAFVILACRVYFKTAEKHQLDEFIQVSDIKWPRLMDLCRQQRVRPVVYKIIVDAAIPPEIKTVIKSELLILTKMSWSFAFETERIIMLLKANGIWVLPYKGVAFSKQFFGDLNSRESSDIDLVIQKEDLPKVIEVMENDGYISESKDVFQYLGKKYFLYLKDYNLNSYAHGNRRFHLELHWNITDRGLGIPENIARLIYKSGNHGSIFKKELAFIDATSHFVAVMIHHSRKDVLRQLKNILDIGVALRDQYQLLNHNELNSYIKEFKLKRNFYVSLILMNDLFGVNNIMPVNANVPQRVSRNFTGQLLGNKIGKTAYRSKSFVLNQIMLCDNFYQKVKFIISFNVFLFYPTIFDFQFIQLPPSLFFLYPFLRPVRFLFQKAKL